MSGDVIVATFSGEEAFLNYLYQIDSTLSASTGILIIICLCVLVLFFINFIFGRGV